MEKISLIIMVLLATYVGFSSIINTKTLNNVIDKGFEITKNEYQLEELDIGEFKKILIYKVLPFNSKVYEINKIGILAELKMNVGVMGIFSFNISPYYKDMPLITIEYVIILNNIKLIIEIYDLMLNKDEQNYKNFLANIEEIKNKYSELKDDFDSGDAWYSEYVPAKIMKSGSILDDGKFLNLFSDVVSSYIDYSNKVLDLSQEDIKSKYNLIKNYSEKLAEKGGIAINNFKNTLGEQKTKEFLGKVIYGYDHIDI